MVKYSTDSVGGDGNRAYVCQYPLGYLCTIRSPQRCRHFPRRLFLLPRNQTILARRCTSSSVGQRDVVTDPLARHHLCPSIPRRKESSMDQQEWRDPRSWITRSRGYSRSTGRSTGYERKGSSQETFLWSFKDRFEGKGQEASIAQRGGLNAWWVVAGSELKLEFSSKACICIIE